MHFWDPDAEFGLILAVYLFKWLTIGDQVIRFVEDKEKLVSVNTTVWGSKRPRRLFIFFFWWKSTIYLQAIYCLEPKMVYLSPLSLPATFLLCYEECFNWSFSLKILLYTYIKFFDTFNSFILFLSLVASISNFIWCHASLVDKPVMLFLEESSIVSCGAP